MVNVRCRTNLDCDRGVWHFPNIMECRPIEGDYVKATNGITLKVYRVTHCEDSDINKTWLEVELNK